MTPGPQARSRAEPSQPAHQHSAGAECPQSAEWISIVSADKPAAAAERPLLLRRLILQMVSAAFAVALLVAFGASALSHRIAENQAVHEVAHTTDILAESVVQPALTDQMAGDIKATATLDQLVRSRVLSSSVVRVKLWSPQGTVLYSDDARLIGSNFNLDGGAKTALSEPQTRAEVSDLGRPENIFERSQGKLLEVYRPVWTPDGHELLFETYFRYDAVSDRSSQLWRGFAGITLSSVAVIFVLLVPVLWALLRRARESQVRHEVMIQRALDASLEERKRIAADLHDGVVQEVAAAAFAVAGGAQAAAARGEADLAAELHEAAGTVRASMGGLRALVVDLYPASLRSAGLIAALRDLAATIATRGPSIRLELDDTAAAALTPDQQQALFRLTQEALRNAVKHARSSEITLLLAAEDSTVRLEVTDDGVGFDQAADYVGHLGLSLMAEVAASIGAGLELRTAPGQGTAWRVKVITT